PEHAHDQPRPDLLVRLAGDPLPPDQRGPELRAREPDGADHRDPQRADPARDHLAGTVRWLLGRQLLLLDVRDDRRRLRRDDHDLARLAAPAAGAGARARRIDREEPVHLLQPLRVRLHAAPRAAGYHRRRRGAPRGALRPEAHRPALAREGGVSCYARELTSSSASWCW